MPKGKPNVERDPTEKQRAIFEQLLPYLEVEVLPWGIFSKIARETGVTPAYVGQMYERLSTEREG